MPRNIIGSKYLKQQKPIIAHMRANEIRFQSNHQWFSPGNKQRVPQSDTFGHVYLSTKSPAVDFQPNRQYFTSTFKVKR